MYPHFTRSYLWSQLSLCEYMHMNLDDINDYRTFAIVGRGDTLSSRVKAWWRGER